MTFQKKSFTFNRCFWNCFTLNYVNSSVRFWERKNILMTQSLKGGESFFFVYSSHFRFWLFFIVAVSFCTGDSVNCMKIGKNDFLLWELRQIDWEKLSKVKSFNLVSIKLISHHLKKNNFKILVAINITWFKAGQFNFQKNLLKLAR